VVEVLEVRTPLRTRSPEDERRLEAFEQRMAMPIFLSAILPIILTLAGNDSTLADVVLVVTWLVFVVDFVVHIQLIPRYVRRGVGIFDLVVVLLSAPWFLIPGLGNSRVLALARLARLGRVLKASGGRLKRLGNQLGRVGLVTGAIMVTCAYVGYGAEHAVNKDFATYGDALWWAIVTVTTVGYGDIVPITTAGRLSGVALMLAGVAVLGVLAGTLASFFGFGQGQPAREHGEAAPASVPAATGAGTEAKDGAQEVAGLAGAGGDAADVADVVALRARLADVDRALAELEERLR
jgi:voltage-gated potassium channel